MNSQGESKKDLLENLRSALQEAIEMNRSEALAAAEGSDFERIRVKIDIAA